MQFLWLWFLLPLASSSRASVTTETRWLRDDVSIRTAARNNYRKKQFAVVPPDEENVTRSSKFLDMNYDSIGSQTVSANINERKDKQQYIDRTHPFIPI
jgi:hypothetical protein